MSQYVHTGNLVKGAAHNTPSIKDNKGRYYY